jgi:hypothetical protein
MDPDIARLLGSRRYGGALLPILVSLGLLLRLWWRGDLYGVSGFVFCSWFLIASVAQIVGLMQLASAGRISLWILGLVAQTLLTLVLLLKKQMTDI